MARPGDIVHVEHYEAPPTGALYACEVVAKRSGGYMAVARQLDGPISARQVWHTGSRVDRGFKTVKGAVRAAQSLARGLEDVTYREDYDPDA